jgi:hypothetical protein
MPLLALQRVPRNDAAGARRHELINATSFAAFAHLLTEASGREVVAIVVKDSFIVQRATTPTNLRPMMARCGR